jgi:RimJ/RimL family protein N-acetyltransferase/L-amino acid N-acyltransferase YncA
MSPTLLIRPVEPERDFGQIAAWFALLEEGALSEQGLRDYYARRRERITAQVAADETGKLLGFAWLYRASPEAFQLDLLVDPRERGQGAGRQLYAAAEAVVAAAGAQRLACVIADNAPEIRGFAERRGFTEKAHAILMALDLETFDDSPYLAALARLKAEGFQFTNMAELGNTEAAQRQLYALNRTTDMETPGADGTPAWETFEDFQQGVCQASWYRPAGQFVVIEAATGLWVGMSATTRFDGVDYAYNLFTGVDKRYRGRKLAQSVKILALRYAREVLAVRSVHTQHNAKNLPMIAIDRKFGYVQIPGTFTLEKRFTF